MLGTGVRAAADGGVRDFISGLRMSTPGPPAQLSLVGTDGVTECLQVTARSPWRCCRKRVCKAFSISKEIKIPKEGWSFFVLTLNKQHISKTVGEV